MPPPISQFNPVELTTLSLSDAVWIIFIIVILLFVIYSLILLYHWLKYAFSSLILWPIIMIYLGVSFIIVSIMFFSAISLT